MKTKRKLPPKDQLIMGAHALYEMLQWKAEKIIKIYTVKGKGERKTSLIARAKEEAIPIEFVEEELLTYMVSSDSHQSFVAHIQGRSFLSVKSFIEKGDEKALVLMIDQVYDPQNFGALLRTAECFGAAVCWSKNRGADITPIVTKTSSGASELVSLIRVSNLAEAAKAFQVEGFEVITTAAKKENTTSLFDFSFSSKTVVVVGSEGEGIQPLIQKRSDHTLYIPMQGKVGSLNVAQAASVTLALYRLKQL